MRVNSVFKAFSTNRATLLYGILILLIIFLLATSFRNRSWTDLQAKQINLSIREIGHRLLLQSGDSTSRVLPVKEISSGVFLLEFENQFNFKPDTLVALTQRLLTRTNLPKDYTVTVHDCSKQEIVYGFQISPPNNNIQPCNGRRQAQGCYTMQIAFANFNTSLFDYTSVPLLASIVVILLGVVIVVERQRIATRVNENVAKPNLIPETEANLPSIGKFLFDIQNVRLLSGDQIIVLTDKECKILEMLNQNFNQLTPREDLIQQIWTNEGVVTGRSLDMFVSKLRKKLSADSMLRITNVHGKGYKLELITDSSLMQN